MADEIYFGLLCSFYVRAVALNPTLSSKRSCVQILSVAGAAGASRLFFDCLFSRRKGGVELYQNFLPPLRGVKNSGKVQKTALPSGVGTKMTKGILPAGSVKNGEKITHIVAVENGHFFSSSIIYLL
ncbi:hypothetical protein HY933_02345 [Candidatus Falkowbacteria bacterium]|nr:hypothetical protein [Candidatus Falkowbacteria bacterium]